MTNEQLLVEVEESPENDAPRGTIRQSTEENLSWFGRAQALVGLWKSELSSLMWTYEERIHGLSAMDGGIALNGMLTLLHQARHDLRMQTVGPMNVAVAHGMVFDYFDEIRKMIELYKQELFFIDPYLDAEFISRYLPHVPADVSARLLAREKLSTLLPAVEAFVQQHKAKVEVRSAPNFHDRYLIVDRTACYQSGASFKDGGRTSPTTLTQITEAFAAVSATYEDKWNQAKIER